ncbi:hypothetical protein TNCV_3169421 [Trichonephila clavipes]|nr:hypothetical protein TNCV_3169421 [Trichonephila clavipes]
MPDSPSQMIPDMLDWRQIWGMGKPRKSKYSTLFVCATKVRLSKQQDEDHERYAAQRYPTHIQSVTYPANTQASVQEEAVPACCESR